MTELLRVGIVGLGGAAMSMLPSLVGDERVRIAAVADVDTVARRRFAEDFSVPGYGSVEDLCRDPDVDAVYIATPHAFHALQAVAAAVAGKHLLVEKPLALTLDDCLQIRAAAEKHGVHVVVGHTHAFDPPVLRLAELLRSGRLGRLAMLNTWNFGGFLYRPRRPEELDTTRGGGIIYNQVPHQVDVVRLLGGGRVRSVRSAAYVLDATRPTEGSHATFLEFEDGAAATLVYSGYDYFDTDEFHGWVGELGEPRPGPSPGARRRSLREATSAQAEDTLKSGRGYRTVGRGWPPPPAVRHQPHFGMLVASCEGGDARLAPDGLVLYTEAGIEEISIPAGGPYPDKSPVVDELYRAAVLGQAPVHSAAWGAATVEVCEAILTSARERREVFVSHQVPA